MVLHTAGELLERASRALEGQGVPSSLVREIAAEFVAAEYCGVRTSG